MTHETQRKIFEDLDRLVQDCGWSSWEAMLEGIREGIGRLGPGIADSVGEAIKLRVLGDNEPDPLGGRPFHEVLLELDTDEKLIAVLEALPEPDPSGLKPAFAFLKTILLELRGSLLAGAKQLPPDPGGRPQRFPDEKERVAIRKEIADLRPHMETLKEAQQRVADRRGAKLRTIQRIWLEGKKREKRQPEGPGNQRGS